MLQIKKKFVDEMVSHAKSELPNECCGILAGPNGEVAKSYRMSNVEASPYRFSMDPGELIKIDSEAGDKGWELQAIYHSHTGSEAYPSDTDVRIAGEVALDMTDYGVEPPVVMLGLMRVRPQIRIEFSGIISP